MIAFAIFSSSPNCLLTIAAHFFNTPNALIIGGGIKSKSLPISKFYSDLYVWAPQNLFAGTLIGPKVSY